MRGKGVQDRDQAESREEGEESRTSEMFGPFALLKSSLRFLSLPLPFSFHLPLNRLISASMMQFIVRSQTKANVPTVASTILRAASQQLRTITSHPLPSSLLPRFTNNTARMMATQSKPTSAAATPSSSSSSSSSSDPSSVETVQGEIVDESAELDPEVDEEGVDEDVDEEDFLDAEVNEEGMDDAVRKERAELRLHRAELLSAYLAMTPAERTELPERTQIEMEELLEEEREDELDEEDEEDLEEVDGETKKRDPDAKSNKADEDAEEDEDEGENAVERRKSRKRQDEDALEDEDDEPEPLRPHKPRLRGKGEDFAGYIVSVVSSKDPILRRFDQETRWSETEEGQYELADEVEDDEEFFERRAKEEEDRQDPDVEEDPYSDIEDNPETYHEAHDPKRDYYMQDPDVPEEEFKELIHWFNPLTNRSETYVVGGTDVPPPFWPPKNKDWDRELGNFPDTPAHERRTIDVPPGRAWLTWERDWDDIRKNGIEPSDEEIQLYLKEILGIPKLQNHPMLPELVHPRPEQFDITTSQDLEPRPVHELTESLPLSLLKDEPLHPDSEEYQETLLFESETSDPEIVAEAERRAAKEVVLLKDLPPPPPSEGRLFPVHTGPRVVPKTYNRIAKHPDDVLKTEAGWQQYIRQGMSPRTWFEESRIQYKKKLHLVRCKYLAEYRRVKALHEANIQARWDQHQQIKRENDAFKARRKIEIEKKQEKIYDMWAARRALRRNKSRFTRQNKEMKQRRHHIHMFNYIMKERNLHWVQPKLDAKTNKYVDSPNLNVSLFEKQASVVGFWPKPPEQDFYERRDEKQRRRAIKEQA